MFLPLTAILLSGLHPSCILAASGLSNFCRITVGAFGASIATTVWEDRTTLHHAQLVEQITPFHPAATQSARRLDGRGAQPEQSLATLDRLVTGQAGVLAANEYALFGCRGFCFLPCWRWCGWRGHQARVAVGPGADH